MLNYPVDLTRDTNDTILVSFPDIPEAHTFGEDEDEALLRAVDALQTALSMYIEDRREIPEPSSVAGEGKTVALPALVEAKVILYQEMRRAGVRKSTLAQRLGWHMPQVDRLWDLNHASRLDQLEAAFAALNKQLTIEIRDAA